MTATLLALCLVAIYNANGREIGSIDSQPTKYTATELLRRGTLSLNHVVGARPELASRPTFVRDGRGRYWSAYPPAPAIVAAAIAWPLVRVGLIDLDDPAAPALVAALASSALTAFAVAVCFLTARRVLTRRAALLVAAALGIGTGLWPTASQTLWQHESAIAGLSVAVWAITRPVQTRASCAIAGVGLALAITSRVQLVPAVSALLLALRARSGPQLWLIPAAIVAAAGSALAAFNLAVFGHVLGGIGALEAMHSALHATRGSLASDAVGFVGLLISPSRGLLIYSPVVGVAAAGWSSADPGWRPLCRWCGAAAACQFVFYASYSVWWGGHTYGPRYLLDVLPLLVPMAAEGVRRVRWPSAPGVLAAAALAWSIAVAALGAFVYPNERWNIDPLDVDRHHARLWDWRDPQIVRAWHSAPSPRNFMLFERRANQSPAAPVSVRSRQPSALPTR